MLYYLLALIAGATATLQAGINAKLQSFLGSPVLASLVSFIVGSIGLAVVYGATILYRSQQFPAASAITATSGWMWLGGLLGAFFVFTTVFCVPHIGSANLFSLIVAGQMIVSIIFDQFGLLGSPLHLISPLRLLGILFLIGGVYLVQTN